MLRLLAVCIIALTPWRAFAADITVLVLGDSISAGYGLSANQVWVDRLKSRLDDARLNANVINASISGDTTRGGLERLPAALTRHEPDIVIIELGGNDGLRGLSLKAMRQNLEQMVTLSKDFGARVLLLGMRIPSNYGPAYTTRFNAVFHAAAEATEVALMPFFLEPIVSDNRYFQADGIHPSAEAQPLLLDALWPYLKPLLPEPLSVAPQSSAIKPD
ncbi:MAG TPA: arylesterase [Gammaproteobacteria bacterium]|nr:arylesterase [Gammaproteobacteria bacterium]